MWLITASVSWHELGSAHNLSEQLRSFRKLYNYYEAFLGNTDNFDAIANNLLVDTNQKRTLESQKQQAELRALYYVK